MQYEPTGHAMPQIGPNNSAFKGKDSCGFCGMCPEEQEQDHYEVQRYQLARLYDQDNWLTQHNTCTVKRRNKDVETEN